MKYCIAHPVYFWTLLFLYSIVRNNGIASGIPDTGLPLRAISESKEMVAGEKRNVNFMRNCPANCRCHMQVHKSVTNCSSGQLKNIPPMVFTSTTELIFVHNNLTRLNYKDSLKELEILHVSDNSIIFVDKYWLSTLTKLQNLDISKNLLQSINIENVFSNIPLNLLNLSFNDLEEITQTMFKELNLLKILDLSWNRISKMGDKSFYSLGNLEELDLSFNQLVDLKHESFTGLTNLKTLILKNNQLKLLRNLVFTPMNKLEYLDLSQNVINSVGRLSFKGLFDLETLNISNNNVTLIQEETFRHVENCKIIDLSNNSFQNLDKIFQYSTNLEVLYLKFLRQLENLTNISFLGLQQLKVLDLSGSKSVTHISLYAFSSTKKLKNLDISYLNLTTLKGGVFKGLTEIETITLKGNPWKCDCYLYWLLVWLGENTNAHLLSPSETVCHFPSNLRENVLLDALDHDMVCTNPSISQYTKDASYRVGSTALLKCHVEGSPAPILTWVTPQKLTFHWLGTENTSLISKYSILSQNHPTIHMEQESVIQDSGKDRFLLLKNGDLLIKSVERGDGGFYMCVASNPLSNHSIPIRLTLDYGYLVHIKIVSILVGLATSFGFLLLTLFSVLIKMILRQCGVKWPCRSGKSSPKSQQIRKILESMEHYKKQQLERLRENYNFQVQRIKDNCMQQMERLRESYSSQSERLRDICDYGTLQIDRIRENYYSQVQRVREYSVNQIERLRENYLQQRNRIRKFSAHHLYKLRENYKLQQQHLNKILENLNIESCRNVCQRTDSIIFEPDITLENVFVPKICLAQSLAKNTCDSVDNSSQISAYFTPDDAASEVSGHESDLQDSSQSRSIITGISNHESHVDVELRGCPVETSETDSTISSLEIFQNAELVVVDTANETIV